MGSELRTVQEMIADEILKMLEQEKEAPMSAVQNLRGIWLVARAQDMQPAMAEPHLAKAADLFRQAAEAGEVDAWLNLAMLLSEQHQPEEARAAAREYVEQSADEVHREIVRTAFGL